MRERGFRTAMLDSEKTGDYWLLSSRAGNWRLTRRGDGNTSIGLQQIEI
jgi:hypothetical protein